MYQLDRLSDSLELTQKNLLEDSEISPEAFNEWRSHPITKLMMLDLSIVQLDTINKALNNPAQIDWHGGFNESVEQVLTWTPVEEKEDEQA